jgi:hypothetical protein
MIKYARPSKEIALECVYILLAYAIRALNQCLKQSIVGYCFRAYGQRLRPGRSGNFDICQGGAVRLFASNPLLAFRINPYGIGCAVRSKDTGDPYRPWVEPFVSGII